MRRRRVCYRPRIEKLRLVIHNPYVGQRRREGSSGDERWPMGEMEMDRDSFGRRGRKGAERSVRAKGDLTGPASRLWNDWLDELAPRIARAARGVGARPFPGYAKSFADSGLVAGGADYWTVRERRESAFLWEMRWDGSLDS